MNKTAINLPSNSIDAPSGPIPRLWWLLACCGTLLGATPSALAADELAVATLTKGRASLRISTNQATAEKLSVSLSREFAPNFAFIAEEPISLELLNRSGATNWLSGGYGSVTRAGAALRCRGQVCTAAGSIFDFTDTYSPGPAPNSFELAREVKVLSPSTNDLGFLSRFSLRSATPADLRHHEFFIPGIWYQANRFVPARALAANLSDEAFIIREDRMPLPLVTMRNTNSGNTITLIHLAPDGSTSLSDNEPGRVVDGRIQVASLGVLSRNNPAVAFCYPAAEGERSYLRESGRGRDSTKRWVERFHPVQAGVRHSYRILIDLSVEPDFPTAMRHAWRTAFENIHPPTARTDVRAAYEASIGLIADWSKTYPGGSAGIPFRLKLPQGELEGKEHINFQMGFVGQQLPLAYHLLRYGLVNHREEITRKGEAMVDFWAANSLTTEGLPRTWFDVYPQPHWRPYNTFLRIASDGMVGALMAWDVMRAAGREKPEWLQFCRRFGDWLVKHQNPDGSWYREYDWSSQPANEGKQNTSHPIRFLVDLSKETGEKEYLDAALRAADWCYPNIHQAFAYVGGTADNPNVLDKEAGFMAMDAFLALHDVTGEKRWLDAAAQAADFTETWVYSWNIPIPADDPAANYPKGCTTTGFSLIATGHSGADLFMAGGPFFYYRLYLETGDAHYAEMARQLLYDTKQGMDIDGSLGYGHTGLCTEALSLAPPRGHGVNTWLPWLTYSMIEPIVNLQEAYGVMDTPIAQGERLSELRMKDVEFGRTRGLSVGKGKRIL
jgi:hypothetical protein